MAHVSHRLKGSFAGALAGGGDPATSPLYVFGPYLRLLAASGIAAVCFGASIWLVVLTVIAVSLTYRKVMQWVTDGSGGSGLCEEELGGWAVKVNAAITVIEYTLTFLVSIAALVTFVADRFPAFSNRWARTALALAVSALTAVIVNRGPKMAARVFGPATAAVLLLLWMLVIATVVERGLSLPGLHWGAFGASGIRVTLGAYVRLLALMTGVEVFANLVAAYDGKPRERARKAFGSLALVMGTTLVTMLVVGPAIFALADPSRKDVSVITQTMDILLPAPLPYVGTVVGIVVLLSAAAASAQGLQNLALGLRYRHYLPASFGQRNRHDVADRPVWIQLAVVCVCFLVLGTHEDTYLSLYAAGVFVLLSLTGVAAVKRLFREIRGRLSAARLAMLGGAVATALLTTGAAVLIFVERGREGAWAYLLLVPALYVAFARVRARLGKPNDIEDRLGRALGLAVPDATIVWPTRLLVVVDGSSDAEAAVLCAVGLAARFRAPAYLCVYSAKSEDLRAYGEKLAALLVEIPSLESATAASSPIAVEGAVRRVGADLVIVAADVAELRALPGRVSVPTLLVHAGAPSRERYTLFERVLVGVDGSAASEAVLPILRTFLRGGAKVTMAVIGESESESSKLETYGHRVVESLREDGVIELEAGGSGPARTLAALADERDVDLVLVATHGRGGIERSDHIKLGSVPTRLLTELSRPLLVVPSAPAPTREQE
ncbi:MAG: universal stress protein [Myxococcales bacterium]|nr:universal stress protein [Myxococcales bacterium]